MPIVKLRRGEIKVPFDPKRLAALIYQFGFDVLPDQDTPESQIQVEKELLHGELRKLWGDKNLRKAPMLGRQNHPGWMNPNPPEIYRAPVTDKSDFLNVEPNPFIEFEMRKWPGRSNPFSLDEV